MHLCLFSDHALNFSTEGVEIEGAAAAEARIIRVRIRVSSAIAMSCCVRAAMFLSELVHA